MTLSTKILLVQFLKVPLDNLKKVPTRMIVYGVSFAVLLVARIFTEPQFSVETVALCLVNAILVALSAMSLYEQAIADPEATKNTNIIDDTAQALANMVATQQAQSGSNGGISNQTTNAVTAGPTNATDAAAAQESLT